MTPSRHHRPRTLGRALLTVAGALVLLAGVSGLAVFAATTKPDYTLGVSPASQSVQAGQTVTVTLSVTGIGGFSGAVALSASGLPAGATAAFGPAAVSPPATSAGTSILTVTTSRSTPVGTSTITITGTNGSTKRTVTENLTVTAALTGSYSLGAGPAAVSLAPGSTAVYTVTLTRSGGFAGAVALTAYGSWPAGTTAAFTPSTFTGTATTSTLQVATTKSTPDGTYTLYLVGAAKDAGSGATVYQYAQAQLTVDSKLSSKPFTLSGGAPTRALAPGVAGQPLNLAVTNPNNQPLSVTNLTVTVSGTSAAACAASNFAVVQYSGPYPLAVPANAANVTLSALGIPAGQQPQLQMVDLPTNQDACKGVTVGLAYSGSAQGS